MIKLNDVIQLNPKGIETRYLNGKYEEGIEDNFILKKDKVKKTGEKTNRMGIYTLIKLKKIL